MPSGLILLKIANLISTLFKLLLINDIFFEYLVTVILTIDPGLRSHPFDSLHSIMRDHHPYAYGQRMSFLDLTESFITPRLIISFTNKLIPVKLKANLAFV